MSTPDLECPMCGFAPIRSGLTACRGCGATITYFDSGLTFLLGILGAGALFGFPLVAALGFGISALIGLGAGIVVLVLILHYAKRVENSNKASGQAYFHRPDHSR